VRVVREQRQLRRQARTGQDAPTPVAGPVALDDGANDGGNDGGCYPQNSRHEPSTRTAIGDTVLTAAGKEEPCIRPLMLLDRCISTCTDDARPGSPHARTSDDLHSSASALRDRARGRPAQAADQRTVLAMITLPGAPALREPSEHVRLSYLVGEQADRRSRGEDTEWLAKASTDFAGHVRRFQGVQMRWGVPSTVYWYCAGEYYLGTLVLRHELTPDLAEAGGHIGYHVVLPWQRQGHATRMLAEGLARGRDLGLDRVLLTCDRENEASRQVTSATGACPTDMPEVRTATGSISEPSETQGRVSGRASSPRRTHPDSCSRNAPGSAARTTTGQDGNEARTGRRQR
jgi:predicted acetyltransferase